MSSVLLWQQILALDAKYNAYRTPKNPQFHIQYIRRRSQLLRENAKKDPVIRKKYLHIRKQLLSLKYGQVSEASSLQSASIRGSTSQLDKSGSIEDEGLKKGQLIPTHQADASRAMVGGNSVGENYAFVGMHHIFHEHEGFAVTSVQFAHDDKNMLAYSSMKGVIFICKLIPAPCIAVTLKGHTNGVTDFAWSLSNDLIVSVSLDASLKLWETNNGNCLRHISSVMINLRNCAIHCCMFQPVNNNIVVLGNSIGQITAVNISTGKTRKGASGKLNGAVLTISFDSSGRILWAGDDKGMICSFKFDLATSKITKCHQMVISAGCPVTSIQSRSWLSREARDPSVLVNVAANTLCLYRVVGDQGKLQFKKNFTIKHKKNLVRSVFCPLISFRQGACVVTGSEDMSVYFFDVEQPSRPCINKLQGHSSCVIDVAFNFDESLLSSCDTNGMVIIWKRESGKKP